jgi:hypothetical protein
MVLKRKMLPEKRSSRDTIVCAADACFVTMAESPIFESRRSGFTIRLQEYSYQLPRVDAIAPTSELHRSSFHLQIKHKRIMARLNNGGTRKRATLLIGLKFTFNVA